MNEQNEFLDKLIELTEIAKDQENVVFTDQIFAVFPETEGDGEKYDLIKNYLTEKKIGIDEKPDISDIISSEEKNYLDFYLDDLKEIDELSDGEKKAAVMSAMAGEESGRNILINDYLKNVVEISKLYAGQGVLLEDLIGEGNVALIKAVTLLGSIEDPKEADGFIAGMIMDAMQDIIAENMDELKSRDNLVNMVNKISKASKDLSMVMGRKVTVSELSKESKIPESRIFKALKATSNKLEYIEIPDNNIG